MVEEQRRREADEARNLRAARDLSATAGFQRMSLGSVNSSTSSGGQPSAPSHAPQQYPPPYQVPYPFVTTPKPYAFYMLIPYRLHLTAAMPECHTPGL